MLTINESLITINLGNNKIGQIGAIALVRALETNKSVMQLSLCQSKNIIDDNEIGNEGGIAIANMLKVNTKIIQADLSN